MLYIKLQLNQNIIVNKKKIKYYKIILKIIIFYLLKMLTLTLKNLFSIKNFI